MEISIPNDCAALTRLAAAITTATTVDAEPHRASQNTAATVSVSVEHSRDRRQVKGSDDSESIVASMNQNGKQAIRH